MFAGRDKRHNILERTFFICHNSKLKALQSQSNTTNASLTLFNNVVVVNVGVNPTSHFPKLKDKFGNKVKDENGKDKRSETSDGLTYTFVEFELAKWLKLFCQKKDNLNFYKLTKSLVLV